MLGADGCRVMETSAAGTGVGTSSTFLQPDAASSATVIAAIQVISPLFLTYTPSFWIGNIWVSPRLFRFYHFFCMIGRRQEHMRRTIRKEGGHIKLIARLCRSFPVVTLAGMNFFF